MSATTRRSALGIIATGPLAMIPALAVMQCSTPADAAGLGPVQVAIAAYRKIDAEGLRFDKDVLEPAERRHRLAVEAIPHHTTRRTFVNVLREECAWSTSDSDLVTIARKVLKDGTLTYDDNYRAVAQELVDAADARQAKVAAVLRSSGLEQACKRSDAYGEKAGDARDRVGAAEPRNLADLAEKLAFLLEEGCVDRFADEILADVQRLARKEA